MKIDFVASFFSDAHQYDSLDIAIRCGEMIELEPAISYEASVPIALPDEFSRVVSTQPESSMALDLERLSPGLHEHGATCAYIVDDAVLFRDQLVKLGNIHAGSRKRRLQSPLADYEDVPEAMLCTDWVIDTYFGHWMTDGLPLEQLATELGLPAVTYGANNWPHVAGYRAFTGFEPRNLEAARFDRLWMVDDRGLNAGRIRRTHQVRDTIRRAAGKAPGNARNVFLMRGQSGARRELLNASEVEAALHDLGFISLDPEQSSAAEVVQCLSGADIVVAVEGSAQSHYLMSGPLGGKLLSIQPPTLFNSIFKTYCDAIGMKWGYVVGDVADDASFTLPVDRLRRALDLIVRA